MSSPTTTTDAARIALAHVCADEADYIDRLVDVMVERDAYRTLAQEAIHTLRRVTAENDRLREQLARLRDEFRFLREQRMREAAA